MGTLYPDTSGRVISIPSKFNTMTAMNSEKKGFFSQTKRFSSHHNKTESPGPGSYTFSHVKCPFSSKGSSGFVASAKVPSVLLNPQRHVPGPGAYNLQSSFMNKWDFNVGVSRVFRTPLTAHLDTPTNSNPAPNQYHIQNVVRDRFAPPGSWSFVSKTRRDSYVVAAELPSPCHYHVEDDARRSSRAVLSPFRSKTQRSSGQRDNLVPGPGAYDPRGPLAPLKRSAPPHRKRAGLLSAPPPPPPRPAPSPGPGHYDVSRDLVSKQTVPTAAFASKSTRMTRPRTADAPGPGFYDPRVNTKRSFFYSDSRIWRPV
ncbi:O(6)-methylguanine-induced apoptosis 2 [Eucyclogobius newberryi]|uniref:O(6)-methylguanine-induced apoptosis 2 n=1 Tax=Eucyclogobius newberryi TaxID=166745 RepID=UPI003B5A305C